MMMFRWLSNSQLHHVESFSFFYSTGTMINAFARYKLTREKTGVYTVTICPDGVDPEDTVTMTVDDSFVQRLLKILRQYHVGYWNGFNKSNRYVKDGNSFSLNVSLQNGRSIDSHGYMRWPKHYKEVRASFNELFLEAYHHNNNLNSEGT